MKLKLRSRRCERRDRGREASEGHHLRILRVVKRGEEDRMQSRLVREQGSENGSEALPSANNPQTSGRHTRVTPDHDCRQNDVPHTGHHKHGGT